MLVVLAVQQEVIEVLLEVTHYLQALLLQLAVVLGVMMPLAAGLAAAQAVQVEAAVLVELLRRGLLVKAIMAVLEFLRVLEEVEVRVLLEQMEHQPLVVRGALVHQAV